MRGLAIGLSVLSLVGLGCSGEVAREPISEEAIVEATAEPAPARSPDETDSLIPAPALPAVSGAVLAAQHQEGLRLLMSGDNAAASDTFESSCEGGFASSCLALADLLEGTDTERSATVLQQACFDGSTAACDRLGH